VFAVANQQDAGGGDAGRRKEVNVLYEVLRTADDFHAFLDQDIRAVALV